MMVNIFRYALCQPLTNGMGMVLINQTTKLSIVRMIKKTGSQKKNSVAPMKKDIRSPMPENILFISE